MLHLIYVIIIGLIVGAIAKFIMPGKDPGGIIVTILLGIAGAFVASWVGHALHFYHEGDKAGFIASLLGAIAILFVYRLFFNSARSD